MPYPTLPCPSPKIRVGSIGAVVIRARIFETPDEPQVARRVITSSIFLPLNTEAKIFSASRCFISSSNKLDCGGEGNIIKREKGEAKKSARASEAELFA